jgi:hypothetical protein
MYTRNQLIMAQQKYNINYINNKKEFDKLSPDRDFAIEQIDYLISLINNK